MNYRKKIPRASNTSRVFGPDDPRMEANSRRMARDNARATRAEATAPKGVSAESGEGDSGLRLSKNGTLLGSVPGIDLNERNGVDVRIIKLDDKAVVEMSLSDGDYGDITISQKGGLISVNDAAVLTQARLGLQDIAYTADATDILTGIMDTARLGTGTADDTTYLRGDQTWSHIEVVRFPVKNTSGVTILKGYPVYATGSVGASGQVEVAAADATVSIPTKMPAIGILEEELIDNAEGFAVSLGIIRGLDTSTYSINSPLYVAAGGGLTATRPLDAGQLVQNIARVVRSHLNTGEILVLGPGRTNDVPNYNEGVLVGRGSTGGDGPLDEITLGNNLNLTGKVLSIKDGTRGDVVVSSSGDTWTIGTATVTIPKISATGTPSASTYLRGDGTWATVSGGGSVGSIQRIVSLRI